MFNIRRVVALLLAVASAALAAVAVQNVTQATATDVASATQQANAEQQSNFDQQAAPDKEKEFDRYPDDNCDEKSHPKWKWQCYYANKKGAEKYEYYKDCEKYEYSGRKGKQWYYHCRPKKRPQDCYYYYYHDKHDYSWHKSWYCPK